MLLLLLLACGPGSADLDADGDGVLFLQDCDDADAAVHPGAEERCDGRDDDCDGQVDELVRVLLYVDADGDGHGPALAAAEGCPGTTGYVLSGADCDDTDRTVGPDATEVCDGVDNDCDGTIDGAGAADVGPWYTDLDGDGYGSEATGEVGCLPPVGVAATGGDCDDTTASTSPNGREACNGVDDDCNGVVDDVPDATEWHPDADGDGAGDAFVVMVACEAPAGAILDGSDCDDADPDVRPGVDERCDDADVDEDCDGRADDADDDAVDTLAWYLDADGDGHGDALGWACDQPAGFVAEDGDCDDGDPTEHPGAWEVCDGDDDDCDGVADEDDAEDAPNWYRDADGDGYGGTTRVRSCAQPAGSAATGDDCDDTSAAVSPGAVEACDPLDTDEDCDGLPDEHDDDVTGLVAYYADVDGDGFGAGAATEACDAPARLVADGTDCDDGDPRVSPDADEVCDDGVDDDCDGADPRCARRGDFDPEDADVYLEGTDLVVGDGSADLDGDGRADLLVSDGAYLYQVSARDASLADAEAWALGADPCLELVTADTDGDGAPEIVCGAGSVSDSVYVLPSPIAGGGSVETLATTTIAGAAGSSFGRAVAAGDLDGDGDDELVVSAPGAEALYAFEGPLRTGALTEAVSAFQVRGTEGELGGDLVAAGDVDGDGFDDLAFVTAADELALLYGAGALPTGVASPDVILTPFGFGSSWVLDLGDLNGDGRADLVAATDGLARYVYVYLAAAGGIAEDAAADAGILGSLDDTFGDEVRVVGDVDGDGAEELVVTGGSYAEPATAYLFYRLDAGQWDRDADLTLWGSGPFAGGMTVGRGGDFDGDGFDDVPYGDEAFVGIVFGGLN